MAQPLSNLHCLTSHGEEVFWVFILSLSCSSLCLYLLLTVHHCEEPICPLHTLPVGARLTVGHSPPLTALQVQPEFPLMKYNQRSKRVCENTSLDDFQSHKTMEIISLLKTSENFRSGAQKSPSTWESKAALSLSWAPWSGSVKNLQALFFWYLDFLLSKDLYTVHLRNIRIPFPSFHLMFPLHLTPWVRLVTQMAAFQPRRGTCNTHMYIREHTHMPMQQPNQNLYINSHQKPPGWQLKINWVSLNYLYLCRHKNVQRLCWMKCSCGWLRWENWVIIQRELYYLSAI